MTQRKLKYEWNISGMWVNIKQSNTHEVRIPEKRPQHTCNSSAFSFFSNFMRKYKSTNSKRSPNSNQDKHSNITLRYIITVLLKISDKDKTIRVAGTESACNAGNLGSIPGLGRSPGEGKGYPLQYSGLENPMDSMVLSVAKSRTRLSDFHFYIRAAKEKESLYAKRTDIKEPEILHQKKMQTRKQWKHIFKGGKYHPTPCLSSFGWFMN